MISSYPGVLAFVFALILRVVLEKIPFLRSHKTAKRLITPLLYFVIFLWIMLSDIIESVIIAGGSETIYGIISRYFVASFSPYSILALHSTFSMLFIPLVLSEAIFYLFSHKRFKSLILLIALVFPVFLTYIGSFNLIQPLLPLHIRNTYLDYPEDPLNMPSIDYYEHASFFYAIPRQDSQSGTYFNPKTGNELLRNCPLSFDGGICLYVDAQEDIFWVLHWSRGWTWSDSWYGPFKISAQ